MIKVERTSEGINVFFEKQGVLTSLSTSKILCALGRVPNIEGLNLDGVGITYNKRGIHINAYCETSLKGVYAVGDVVGPYMFSHMANAQAILAVQNALLPFKQKMNYEHVVWCTFTSPELATLGMSEQEATAKMGDRIKVFTFDLTKLDRLKTNNTQAGLVKVILNKNNKLLGCTILSDRAGELISEMAVIKHFNLRFHKLASVIHPYPTYGEVINKIGKLVLIKRVRSHWLINMILKLKNWV